MNPLKVKASIRHHILLTNVFCLVKWFSIDNEHKLQFIVSISCSSKSPLNNLQQLNSKCFIADCELNMSQQTCNYMNKPQQGRLAHTVDGQAKRTSSEHSGCFRQRSVQ